MNSIYNRSNSFFRPYLFWRIYFIALFVLVAIIAVKIVFMG